MAERAALIPSATAGHNKVIVTIFLEHGRSFHEPVNKDPDIFACIACIGRIQFGNVQRTILFGGVDMVSFTVIIDKQIHITCHLPLLHVAAQYVEAVRMGRKTTSGALTFFFCRRSAGGFMNG